MTNNFYFGFVDPSGGSSDSMTLAIAHSEGPKAVLDGVWERKPPFSPESVVEEFAERLKRYGISSITGDRYGGAWPAERFLVHGIEYTPSSRSKSEIYAEFLQLANSGRVSIPLHQRLIQQFQKLERRVARGGRQSIDHPSGGHDDIANAAAGAIVLAAESDSEPAKPIATFISFREPHPKDPNALFDPFNDYGFGPPRRPRF